MSMVKVKEDLTGKVFGRLTVVEQAEDYISPQGYRYAQWKCKCCCEADKTIITMGRHLKTGHTMSCGCLMIEINRENGHKNKKYNKYDLSGKFGIGYCSNTGSQFYFDLEDYDKIKEYCWNEHVIGRYHALETHTSKDSVVRMSWLIVGKDYDHIDRNPLNNKKDNLRKSTDSENNCNHSLRSNNTSGITGVGWDKRSNRWIARISINHKYSHIGYFVDKEDAIVARLQAEAKYYGEFAPQRHLFEQYNISTQQNDSEAEKENTNDGTAETNDSTNS